MATRKQVDVKKGVDVNITKENYISIGANGSDICIKHGEKMIWFDGEDAWDHLVAAINLQQASAHI